jgi:hypothetical protein
MVSRVPPAGKGAMTLSGLEGYACECPVTDIANSSAAQIDAGIWVFMAGSFMLGATVALVAG